MNWLDMVRIDPALPALPFVFDVTGVAQRFEQHWPAQPTTATSCITVATPSITVKECRRQDVHYIPGTRCVATYKLVVAQAGSTPTQTIGVVEVTRTGLPHRLFVDDPQLPGLALAIDGDAMREKFAALREADGQADVVQACTVTPIRYKPGVRCAFRYELHLSSGQERCFGKLLAHNSEPLWQTIVALYQASQRLPADNSPAAGGTGLALPRIAQPLAYWPTLPMVVQAAMAGSELHTIAFDPQIDATIRSNWMQAAGQCSAALHRLTQPDCPVVTGLPQTLTGDLTALNEYIPALRQINPGLADQFEATMAAMRAVAQQQTELAPRLSHGALRTDQFMLENGQLVLIDLDSICWASPARDLGNFLAYLTWKALRQPHHAAFIQQAQQAFLAGYHTIRTGPDAHWVAFYQAAALLKIIGRRYTGLTYEEWPLTELLLDHARKLIRL